MGLKRIVIQFDRWGRRPRFRAPALMLVLLALLTAGLLLSLAPHPSPVPSPPAPARSDPEPPAPLPPATPPAQPPPEIVEPGCPHGCAEPPPGCAIKGNVSTRTGERIYHLPGQRYYDSTVISPAKGETWFCSEAEARENGWRKSRL